MLYMHKVFLHGPVSRPYTLFLHTSITQKIWNTSVDTRMILVKFVFAYFGYLICRCKVMGVKYTSGNQPGFSKTKRSHNDTAVWPTVTPPYNGTPHKKLDKWLSDRKRGYTPYFNFDLEVETTPNIFMSSIYNIMLYMYKKMKKLQRQVIKAWQQAEIWWKYEVLGRIFQEVRDYLYLSLTGLRAHQAYS